MAQFGNLRSETSLPAGSLRRLPPGARIDRQPNRVCSFCTLGGVSRKANPEKTQLAAQDSGVPKPRIEGSECLASLF